MEKLLHKLKDEYPHLTFVQSTRICWSPEKKEIYYNVTHGEKAIAGVLHEIGHARLDHSSYKNDLDLLKKEVEAWEEAQRIANKYAITLDSTHIQDCLDTYRDWLYKRSTCPRCNCNGLQTNTQRYQCLNCGHSWQVTSARFFRPYRLSKGSKKAGC